MKNLAMILLLAFAVSGCASTRAADLSVPQSKQRTAAVAKAKPKAVAKPVPKASQPVTATTEAKPKKNKTWRWFAPWRAKK